MLRITTVGLLLLIGLVYSSWATSPSGAPVINHGLRTIPKIALTFDACPASDARFDEDVVRVLIGTHTPATFFLSGRWIEKFKKEAKSLAKNPLFELGQHGYRHLNLLRANDERVEQEVALGQETFRRVLDLTPTLFRAPYALFDARTLSAARAHHLVTVQYDVASGDPDVKATPAQLERYVLSRARAGSIIIFHVNGRGHHTAQALPGIIQGLSAEGYQFVTVSELLADQRKAADLK